MKRNVAHRIASVFVAARSGPLAVLLASAAALAAAGQAPRPASVHPHATPAQARLRFVPGLLTTVAGTAGSPFSGPANYYNGIAATSAALPASIHSIAFNSTGDLYLIASYPGSLFKIDGSNGTISTVLGTYSRGGGERSPGSRANAVPADQISLNNSMGVAVSPVASVLGATDDVFVADTGDHVIYRLDAQNMVSVVAGTPGQSGYSGDGANATASLLNTPTGLAFDASGNLYVADAGNNAIRKISATDGSITTIAGGNGPGFSGDGGPATAARIGSPFALAFDPSGNLLFTDTANYVVRKINMQQGSPQSGTITTVAGNLTGGYAGDGGPATSAEISNAEGLAVDAAGQIYIGDSSSQVVRRVALDGTISTIAGIDPYPHFPGFYEDGLPATKAYINTVAGLAFDAKGTLYMSALGIARVLMLGPGGALSFGQQEIGTSATQTLTVVNEGSAAATFYNPAFVVKGTGLTAAPAATQGCVQNGTLQPGASCQISVTFSPVTAADYLTTLSLSDDSGSQASAALSGTGVLPDTTTTLSVSPQTASAGDTVSFSATVVRASGTGPTPTGTVQFIDSNTGNVLALGNLNNSGTVSVQISTVPAGYYYVLAEYGGDAAYAASQSDGIALEINTKTATIVLASSATTVTAGGTVMLTAQVSASSGTPTGNVLFQVDGVTAATVALQGGMATATVTIATPGPHELQAVYAGDGTFGQVSSSALSVVAHGAILQFTPGSAVTLAGTPSDDLHGGFSGDGGPAISAFLHTPYGVTTDSAGNVYIADEENNVIRKVALDGAISTVAGVPYAASIYNTVFSGDGGPATSAYLDHPTSVVVDSAGNLFIADYSNNVVRKVTAATGVINTIAGNYSSGPSYNGDNTGTATNLSHPSALALDAAGNLFIADTGHSLVRKLDTSGNVTTVAGSYYLSHYGQPASGVPATSVPLYNPGGVALDAAGNLYIADTGDNLIRKVDASGTITTVGGGASYAAAADNIPALSASLNIPQQMAIDLAGNLYFAEAGNSVIRKIDTSGILSTAVGYIGSSSSPWSHFDPQGEPSTYFQLQSPSGVAVAPDGSVLAVDNYNQTVIRSGTAGAVLFGPESVGTVSSAQAVTLANVGDAPLIFNSTPYVVTGDYTVSATPMNACDFAAPMAPGTSCNINVTYANQGGAQNGTLRFSANVSGTPTVLLRSNTNSIASATALYMSGTTANFGDNLLFFATVAAQGPPATGNVSFYDGANLMGTTAITSGYASLNYASLSTGTHAITAQYLGNGYYAASTSDPQTIQINGPGTVTALSVSSTTLGTGSPLTMTASVTTTSNSVVAEGSVTFYDGSTALGSAAVNASGAASLTVSTLTAGTHAITASYQTNADYAGSTSTETDVTVSSGGTDTSGFDYTIQVDGLPLALHRGTAGTAALNYTPTNYSAGSVTLSCGTLPSYATCSFSPASVNFANAQQQSVTLTITATP